ncbi:MAG: SNF2-related protein [Candidatus Micrarchaeaceae archaeon]
MKKKQVQHFSIRDLVNGPTDKSITINPLTGKQLKDLNQLYKNRPSDIDDIFPSEPLYPHQKEAIRAVLDYPAIFLDIFARGGKTRIILEVLRRQPRKTLVVCYNEISVQEWATQCKKYLEHATVGIVKGKTKQDKIKNALNDTSDIYLVTYGQLITIMTDRTTKGRSSASKDVLMTKEPSKLKTYKYKMVDQERIDKFCQKFSMVVFDESREIAHAYSLTHKMCSKLSLNKEKIVLMSATPFSHDPAPLWSQAHVLDHGDSLHPSFHVFQNYFYKKKYVPFGAGFVMIYQKSKTKFLRAIYRSFALSYDITDVALKFPPQVSDWIRLSSSSGLQIKAYNETITLFIKDLIEAKNDALRLERAKNQFHQLRQIASGFLYHGDQKTALVFPSNPKLDFMENLFEEIQGRHKVVVFYWYRQSGKILESLLTKQKIGFVALTNENKERYKQFTTEDNIRVLIANAAVGGVGLNLSVADYLVFYEPPDSILTYYQAVNRVIVPGKNRPTFIYHLMIKGTVEEQIYSHFKEGKDLWESVLGKNIDLHTLDELGKKMGES